MLVKVIPKAVTPVEEEKGNKIVAEMHCITKSFRGEQRVTGCSWSSRSGVLEIFGKTKKLAQFTLARLGVTCPSNQLHPT